MKSIVRVEVDMRFRLGFQVSLRHLIAAVLLWLTRRNLDLGGCLPGEQLTGIDHHR